MASVSPKPRGREQAGARAVAFDDRVGRLRRAVPERGDLREQLLAGHALLLGGVLHRVEHADLEFARRRKRLGRGQFAVLVEQDEIGERAADIDAQKHVDPPVTLSARVAERAAGHPLGQCDRREQRAAIEELFDVERGAELLKPRDARPRAHRPRSPCPRR